VLSYGNYDGYEQGFSSFAYISTLRTRGAIIFQPFPTFRTMGFLFHFLLNIRICIYGLFYSIINLLERNSFIHMHSSIMTFRVSFYLDRTLLFKIIFLIYYIFSLMSRHLLLSLQVVIFQLQELQSSF
jgi:hypothetical protein